MSASNASKDAVKLDYLHIAVGNFFLLKKKKKERKKRRT